MLCFTPESDLEFASGGKAQRAADDLWSMFLAQRGREAERRREGVSRVTPLQKTFAPWGCGLF